MNFSVLTEIVKVIRQISVFKVLKPCCISLSLILINTTSVIEAFSQTEPFLLDAQLRYNGGGAGVDDSTSVELRIPLNPTSGKLQKTFSISTLETAACKNCCYSDRYMPENN